MEKYIPPEKMTVEQIQANIDERFRAWDKIAQNGCSDPFWPDGVNMNLVRNHIIYYHGLLHEKQAGQVQISLFDAPASTQERPVPPKVPDNYMVAGCEHSHRLDRFGWNDKLVWGEKGEYKA